MSDVLGHTGYRAAPATPALHRVASWCLSMRCFPGQSTVSIALAVLAILGCSEDEPSATVRECRVPVYFAPPYPTRASVVGDFNDWDKDADPLRDGNGDGVYVAWIKAEPGLRQYRIWDGESLLGDPFNPLTAFDATGRENPAAYFSDCSVPILELLELDAAPSGSVRFKFVRAFGGAELDPSSVTATLDDSALELEVSKGSILIALGELAPGKHTITVEASDRSEVSTAPVSIPFWTHDFDWRDALIYQVVVDRFRRGEGALDSSQPISFYHGGDLRGVTRALEEGYFESLGVNTLWLSPLYENPDGRFMGRDGYEAEAYHGYWPNRPRDVEARFGGSEALDELVEVAHERGMRIVVDFVLNHLHETHPYWADHRAHDWFNHPDGSCICGVSCPWQSDMLECWFDPFLPDISWRNPDAMEQLLKDAEWWIERFDLDGLRLDAVPMMPRLAVRHLRHRIHERFETGGSHVYLLGETYTQPGQQAIIRQYLGPMGLSGQFDFPVMWVLRDVLRGDASFAVLEDELAASEAAWEGSGAVMAPILGNHDVPRIVSDINRDNVWAPRTEPPPTPSDDLAYDLLRLAWTFLLTQPGAPIIYYGDELGMPGGTDPDNRRDMRFGDALSFREGTVLAHVQALGRWRSCSHALRRGSRELLSVGRDTYLYGRREGSHVALVALNRSESNATFDVVVPEDWPQSMRLLDVIGRTSHHVVDGTLRLDAPAHTGIVLSSEVSCL